MLHYTLALPLFCTAQWTHAYLTLPETHLELISTLREYGYLKTYNAEEAMLKIDRKFYVNSYSYLDVELGIGYGASISAPHVHALTLDILENHLKPGGKAMDVGSGSGYLTACMAWMVGENGSVVGVDHMEEIVEYAKENISKDNYLQKKKLRIKFVVADGRLGVPEEGPFDAINVGAAATEVPQALVQQLKKGGRLLIPVGEDNTEQKLVIIDKDSEGNITHFVKCCIAYASLTDPELQCP